MANKTYNTGRVVGWSAYEEFLKQNPDITPGEYSETMFLHNIVYGIACTVNLPTTDWKGEVVLTKTVHLPGAVHGVVPIVSLNYEKYQTKETVGAKENLESAASNIFSCYVSNADGTKVTNNSYPGGYITFCAYPTIKETGITEIPLIIRGLGVDALKSPNLYYGPQGMISGFGGGGGGTPDYERMLPGDSNSLRLGMDPVIDMRSVDPATFYNSYANPQGGNPQEKVKIEHLYSHEPEVGIFTLYQHLDNLPPALYGMKATNNQTGDSMMNPVDVVAPYNLKIFDGDIFDEKDVSIELATGIYKNMPWITPLFRDTESEDATYVVYEFNQSSELVPVSHDYYASLYGVLQSTEPFIPYFGWQCNSGTGECKITYFPIIVGSRQLTGCLSEQFRQDYGIEVEYEEYDGEKQLKKDSLLAKILAYRGENIADSGVSRSGMEDLPPEELEKYYFILRGPKDGRKQGTQWSLVPVLIDGGRVNYVDRVNYAFGGPMVTFPFASAEAEISNNHDESYFRSYRTYHSWSTIDKDEDGEEVTKYYHGYRTNPDERNSWAKDTNNPFTAKEIEYLDATIENFKYLGSWYGCGDEPYPGQEGHPSVGEYLRAKYGTYIASTESYRRLPWMPKNEDGTWDMSKSWEKDAYSKTFDEILENVQDMDFLDINGSNEPGSLYFNKEDGGEWVKMTTTDESGNTVPVKIPELLIGENTLNPEFRSKTLRELAELSRLYDLRTGDKVTYTDSKTGRKIEGREFPFYVANREDLEKELSTISENICYNEEGNRADLGSVKCHMSFSTYINESNQNKSISIPIPAKYQPTEGPLASIGISGNSQTMSLSVADKNNNILPMTGSDGVIPSEDDTKYISWDDLLHWDLFIEALAYNKSIDILGEPLRNFKHALTEAGDNYIELRGVEVVIEEEKSEEETEETSKILADVDEADEVNNSIRLYLSKTKPESEDIPEGSIGIGWDKNTIFYREKGTWVNK